jgi:5-methyltetrahydropteroyltriglutamate--homocysteine methyltransferase
MAQAASSTPAVAALKARQKLPKSPRILTSTVGSYPVPAWLEALPSESALVDATRVVFDIQRQAGVELPTDGELYRFDLNHPETNGMIEYFVSRMGGTRTRLGRSEIEAFRKQQAMGFRAKPAAVVEGPLSEGCLDLLSDCARAARVSGGPFKFTLTSPYMLARTLLDRHYGSFEALLEGVAEVLAAQVKDLPTACIQVDEANIPGSPEHGPIAAKALNTVLDAVDADVEKAVHLCFGNYGGQTIQKGAWNALLDFVNSLRVDHLVLELAHRPQADLEALKGVDDKIKLGLGVIDIKVNQVETPDEVAKRLEQAERVLGDGRVKFAHPDCGFWMLKRSISDRKIEALVKGRDLYLGV